MMIILFRILQSGNVLGWQEKRNSYLYEPTYDEVKFIFHILALNVPC